MATSKTSHRPGWIALIVIYLVFAALVVRTPSVSENRPFLPQFLMGELIFIVFFTAIFLAPRLPDYLMHLYFALQSVFIWWLISLQPDFDFLILLYFLLCCQAALVFTRWEGWLWAGIFMSLSAGSLMYYLGVARGLSLAMTTMAAEIVVAAYVRVNREILAARAGSQALLSELGETHQQLKKYASQVEDLAAMQERNRLARELHDSVSQVLFSITLTARSAQLLLDIEPQRLKEQIERVQAMSTDALSQLRSLIDELRPPQST
jgi:signal transduction histidine kinase